MSSTKPANIHDSISVAFNLRRGTVLAGTNFNTLDVWTEEDDSQEKEVATEDPAYGDDYEFDDSIRYIPVTLKNTMKDLWDRLCFRRFYKIEGDKFYFVRTLNYRRNAVEDLCEFNSRMYVVKRIALYQAEDLIKAADQFNNLRNYNHPHVLFAYKAGIANAPTWQNWARTEVRLVMPYIAGHLLTDELRGRGQGRLYMHPRRVLRLCREIFDGLFEIHSHSNGDAHRDIRPGTIVIRVPDDWPVIIELDSCTPAVIITSDEEEVSNIIDISENVTSPFYRAPETFDIRPESVIDERTDIWGMGCTLFAMCFFLSPFQPPDIAEIPPKDFPLEDTKNAILDLTTEYFLENVIPKDSPYPREMHEFMARLLSVELSGRPTTEQAVRELDELIAALGGPDQPICVKYPWINPPADEMAADVLKERLLNPVTLEFDRLFPDLANYSYAEHAPKDSLASGRDYLPVVPTLILDKSSKRKKSYSTTVINLPATIPENINEQVYDTTYKIDKPRNKRGS